MVEGIALFGWTFAIIVLIAIITIWVGEHLND